MSLISSVAMSFRSDLQEIVELTALTASVSESRSFRFESGIDENQCDLVWSDQGSLAGPGSVTLDFQALTNIFGTTINFEKIRAIVIENTGDQTLHVGGASANQLASLFGDVSDKLVIPAGGKVMIIAPTTAYAVSASAKDLKIANVGTGATTYNIWVIGTTLSGS